MSQLFRDKPIGYCDGTCGRIRELCKFMDGIKAKYKPLSYMGIEHRPDASTERAMMGIKKSVLEP